MAGRPTFSKVICKMCGRIFQRRTGTQLYCGFMTDKNSCIYKRSKFRWTKYAVKFKEKYRKKRIAFRFRIFLKFNFTCQYCGRKAPEVELQIDHIFPKSKGGVNDESNYTVACKDCNNGKQDTILNS